MKIGAQGYTVRTFMQNERDIRRTLQKVADIGYTTVQISAIGPIDPKVLRAICDDLGLQIVLTHTPEARLLGDLDRVIAEHDTLGCRYIGIGGMPERYRAAPEWMDYFAEDFMPVAEKMKAAGKLLMYHNHNFEFEGPQGSRIIDKLMAAFPADRMGFTLDTYWLQAAGCDVLAWLARLKDRIPCVHLKDMTVRGMEIRMAAVGQGNMNFPAVIDLLRAQGTTEHLLVEQDDCYGESPFACLQKSYEYLKSLGCK